ncbi:universal stress protein [Caballeronia grimmiae]|uniref:universal stress protein n=1 Tax=Caballeronia grimmiae TaxID=1071679 RepID=UPI0038BC7501
MRQSQSLQLPGLPRLLREGRQSGVRRSCGPRGKDRFPSLTQLVEVNLADDDLAHRIAKNAREFRADLILVGTHGRRGWRRVALTSVSERLVRLAACPGPGGVGQNACKRSRGARGVASSRRAQL